MIESDCRYDLVRRRICAQESSTAQKDLYHPHERDTSLFGFPCGAANVTTDHNGNSRSLAIQFDETERIMPAEHLPHFKQPHHIRELLFVLNLNNPTTTTIWIYRIVTVIENNSFFLNEVVHSIWFCFSPYLCAKTSFFSLRRSNNWFPQVSIHFILI